jgi:hypothetical protein
MGYRTKQIRVEAVRLTSKLGDTLAGSWLVTESDGTQRVVPAEDFEHFYEPEPDVVAAPPPDWHSRGTLVAAVLADLRTVGGPARPVDIAKRIGATAVAVGAVLSRCAAAGRVQKLERGLYAALPDANAPAPATTP